MTRKLEKPLVFGFCGLAGAGKDTAATFVEKYYQDLGYKVSRVKFATGLKDLVASLFSLDRVKLEGVHKVDREWREQPLDEWSKKLGRSVTPRELLQIIGTDLLRNQFHQNIWVDHLDMKIKSEEYQDTDVFLITDCRFPNELEWLKTVNAYMFEVCRFQPQWYLDLLEKDIIPTDIHVSEYAWIKPLHALTSNYSQVGHLDCTVQELEADVMKVLKSYSLDNSK